MSRRACFGRPQILIQLLVSMLLVSMASMSVAAPCASDATCNSGEWCDAGSCVSKYANGTAMPTVASHTPTLDGTCTSAAALSVCQSGVCDPNDNDCGYGLTVSVSPLGGGTATPVSGGHYDPNEVVNLQATAAPSYEFVGWQGPVASPSSAATTVTMAAPESVEADFGLALPVLDHVGLLALIALVAELGVAVLRRS
jgi:hypothetical protein